MGEATSAALDRGSHASTARLWRQPVTNAHRPVANQRP